MGQHCDQNIDKLGSKVASILLYARDERTIKFCKNQNSFGLRLGLRVYFDWAKPIQKFHSICILVLFIILFDLAKFC